MFRAESESQDHFDLLPFITILLCVMGVLLLATLSMAAMYLGQGTERWIPDLGSASGPRPKPVLVEWDGKRATLRTAEETRVYIAELSPLELAGRSRVELDFDAPVPAADLTHGVRPLPELIDWLRQNRGKYYPLFAVRPSGFDTFDELRRKVVQTKLDVGYEPIGQFQRVRIEYDDASKKRPREKRP